MNLTEDFIAREFPQDSKMIYLNHAAVAPWPARTAEAVKRFAEENIFTGAMNYPAWIKKENQLRLQLRNLLNAPSSDDIALLKNTSEALSVVACGIDWKAKDNVVSTNQEFPSNRIVWQAQQRHGIEFREVEIMHTKEPEQALIEACDKNTRVLAVSSVQFGTGIKLHLETLGNYCRENDVLFCVDAIQSIGAHNLDVQKINADFVMADAHKWMLGPEGIAVFYSSEKVREQLQLYQFGWHMVEDCGNYDRKDWNPDESARRFECGSSNMLGIHALSASLTLFEDIGIQVIEQVIQNNISYLFSELNNIKGVYILTPADKLRHAGIITFKIEGKDMADLHRKLMEKKVICAHRMGGIRFSPHFYSRPEKINKALEVIDLIV